MVTNAWVTASEISNLSSRFIGRPQHPRQGRARHGRELVPVAEATGAGDGGGPGGMQASRCWADRVRVLIGQRTARGAGGHDGGAGPRGAGPARAVAVGRVDAAGRVPGAYPTEILVHTWDLAQATGQAAALDPGLVRDALGPARQFAPVAGMSGLIGPALPQPAPSWPRALRAIRAWLTPGSRFSAGGPWPHGRKRRRPRSCKPRSTRSRQAPACTYTFLIN